MTQAADHIMRDLARKIAEDVNDRLKQCEQFLPAPVDRMMLALSATGVAIGRASAHSQVKLDSAGDVLTPDQHVDLMWAIIRPIALSVMGGSDADFQKLLSMCRDDSPAPGAERSGPGDVRRV